MTTPAAARTLRSTPPLSFGHPLRWAAMGAKEAAFLNDVAFPGVRNAQQRDRLSGPPTAVAARGADGSYADGLSAGLGAIVRSPSSIVRAWGCQWLFRLAVQHSPAVDLLRDLFRTGSVPTRLSIAQSVALDGHPAVGGQPNPTP